MRKTPYPHTHKPARIHTSNHGMIKLSQFEIESTNTVESISVGISAPTLSVRMTYSMHQQNPKQQDHQQKLESSAFCTILLLQF